MGPEPSLRPPRKNRRTPATAKNAAPTAKPQPWAIAWQSPKKHSNLHDGRLLLSETERTTKVSEEILSTVEIRHFFQQQFCLKPAIEFICHVNAAAAQYVPAVIFFVPDHRLGSGRRLKAEIASHVCG